MSGIRTFKCRNAVTIAVVISNINIQAKTWTTICTLSADICPKNGLQFLAIAQVADRFIVGYCGIETSGILKVFFMENITGFSICTTYLI